MRNLRLLKVHVNKNLEDYPLIDISGDANLFSFVTAQAAQAAPPIEPFEQILLAPIPQIALPLRPIEEMGWGTNGVVVKAQAMDGSIFAVNTAIYRPDELLHETEIMQNLQHQNVLQFISLLQNLNALI